MIGAMVVALLMIVVGAMVVALRVVMKHGMMIVVDLTHVATVASLRTGSGSRGNVAMALVGWKWTPHLVALKTQPKHGLTSCLRVVAMKLPCTIWFTLYSHRHDHDEALKLVRKILKKDSGDHGHEVVNVSAFICRAVRNAWRNISDTR